MVILGALLPSKPPVKYTRVTGINILFIQFQWSKIPQDFMMQPTAPKNMTHNQRIP